MLRNFSPIRVWKVFRILLTVFILIRKQPRFLFMRPLGPVRLMETVVSLGVSFIKLAQVLATRADFFSEDYLVQLKKVHDELPPMPDGEFREAFRRAFGENPPFTSFDERPIASASIGQVHRACLSDGTEVAVKLRRLGVERLVRDDIAILRFLLVPIRPFLARQTQNSLDAVIDEFASMIAREVDLSQEKEHLKKFRAAYSIDGISFPDFHEDHSGRDALVMSFMHGARIDDRDAVARTGIPFKDIVERIVSFYTEQMLVRGYFHSDPHPGNILVQEDGGIVFLDFGMVKRIPRSTRIAMIEMAKSAHERDLERYIAACKRLGVVSASAPETVMQEFAERMFDIFGSEHLSSATMQALAFEVLSSMRDFPFKLPPDVVYVMRASSLVEGLGTTYIENFNGVKDILPILVRNLPRAMGAETNLVRSVLRETVEFPLTLHRLKTVLVNLSDETQHVQLSRETMERLMDGLRAYLRPVFAGSVLIALAFFVLALGIPHHRTWAVAFFAAGVFRIATACR